MKSLSTKVVRAAPLLAIAEISLMMIAPTQADDYVIYVAPRDTPAATTAEGKANGTTTFSERGMQKAFDQAGALLNANGQHSVSVLIAGGDYAGKAGGGMFFVPQIKNAQGTLRIIGGYNADFSGRQPFQNLTDLVHLHRSFCSMDFRSGQL